MALFSKQLRPKSPEAVKRVTLSVSAAAAQDAETVDYEEVTGPSHRPINWDDQPADGRGRLGKGSKITGKLFFEGSVTIQGQVDGEIGANDSVIIGEGAVVTAQLKADSVVVAGKISGDILAAKRIEIRPTGKVFGNLTTAVLLVHDNALFEGRCTMYVESAKGDWKVPPNGKQERITSSARPR